MNSLWYDNFNEESEIDIKTPKEIIEEQCIELATITSQKVFGRIKEYEGEIRDYIVEPLTATMNGISESLTKGKEYFIQDQLGEIDDNGNLTYEFYLTSQQTPNYKYRVFFIQYNIMLYPVTIVMDKSIAEEINLATEVTCIDEKELEEILLKVFNSKRIIKIIKNLMRLNKNNILN